MSSISSSSSSGFSSISHDQYSSTSTLQTVLDIRRADINARTIFCGEQDSQLNELRRMTGAIIDLHVIPATQCPFERVDWTISHPNRDVRDFVVRRLNYWMQQTQLASDMAYEDAVFLQEQHEKQVKSKQAPPLTAANFGRRQRTRSLTQSDVIHFTSVRDRVPGTPTTSTYKRESAGTAFLGRTLTNLNPQRNDHRGLLIPQIDLHQPDQLYVNRASAHVDAIPSSDMSELLERANWAGALSDASDQELNENRVCFADTVSLSKLAQLLREHGLKLTSTTEEIEEMIEQHTTNVTSREDRRQVDGGEYWFHRLLLDGHIQFPVAIHVEPYQARNMAYRNLADVCLSPGGVKMKMLTGDRVKVVKNSTLKEQHDHSVGDFDINATYISTADLNCLSHCKVY